MPDTDTFEGMLDVPVDVEVGLDGPTLTLNQILALRVGAVIPLRTRIGEELNVTASNMRIGSGELALVQNRFVVRMTRFVGPR